MKIRYIVAAVLLVGTCAFANDVQKPFLLRFVNYDTLRPIATAQVLLVPRREILKVERGYKGGNPNLKYAKNLTTDARGQCQLPRAMAEELTSKGKVYVDCRIEGYPSFILAGHKPAKHVEPLYAITLFDRTDGLMHRVGLRWDEPTVLLLQPKEKKIPNRVAGD
jgi:hypothetical protein